MASGTAVDPSARVRQQGGAKMIRIAARLISSALGVAALFWCTSAEAFTENDMFGKWCGKQTNPVLTNQIIASDTLTVILPRSNGHKVFRIDSFKFGPNTMEVFYFANEQGNAPGNTRTSTKYRITAGGNTMVEQTKDGDYVFTKCFEF
jgi:hypothetical protein